MAAPAAPRRASREGPAERLVELAVLAGMVVLAIAAVLPLLLVAGPVLLALHALEAAVLAPERPPPAALPAARAGGPRVGLRARGETPVDVVMGYVDVQLGAGVGAVRAWQGGGGFGAFDWRGYGLAVGPYAGAGGALLGALAWGVNAFVVSGGRSVSGETGGNATREPAFHDAGVLAGAPEEAVDWALPNVLGRGVMALLSAPPGLGKGWWTWGWLRAMQDRGEFFGLRARRPFSAPGRLARRLGARPRPRKVLWLTEEGASFARTARRFGIAPGLVAVLRRDQVALTAWPELVRLVRREAWRRGCAYVVVDTIRAWCPQAEVSNDGAAAAMNLARREWAGPGLGVLFVHHDRKGGGEYGEGVAGAYNLVGSVDVLIELRRVTGRPDARRMVVSRRFGDLDVTARLDGVRYVADTAAPGAGPDSAPAAPATPSAEAPPVPGHLVGTLDVLRRAGPGGLSTAAVQAATGGAAATVLDRLGALERRGLAGREGAGVKGAPLVWRAVDASPARPASPTADPAYVRYLGSAAWARKRAETLARADGKCEACGAGVPEGEAEVHHLTYARVGEELPEDLVALCPGCHRRAHRYTEAAERSTSSTGD